MAKFTRTGPRNLAATFRAAAQDGVSAAGEHLRGVAQANAPVDEGTLRNSAALTVDGTTATVSFDTPYAVIQHESLHFHHPRGGQAKYLEGAMASERKVMSDIVATAVRRAMGGN